MELHIRKLFREKAEPVHGSLTLDLSGHDFGHFKVEAPVQLTYTATPERGLIRFEVDVHTEILADCARCLMPVEQKVETHNRYEIREPDLEEEFPELPFTDAGLDLQELAYGELILEVDSILLCSEDCPGLCAQCGKRQGECDCEEEPEGDPRLAALRQLLNDQ